MFFINTRHSHSMKKALNPLEVQRRRIKHHERMLSAGLQPVQVYCKPEDLPKLKDLVEEMNHQSGICGSWLTL